MIQLPGAGRARACPAHHKKSPSQEAGALKDLRHYDNDTFCMLSAFASRIKLTCEIVPIEYPCGEGRDRGVAALRRRAWQPTSSSSRAAADREAGCCDR